jgi:hypothetical protein
MDDFDDASIELNVFFSQDYFSCSKEYLKEKHNPMFPYLFIENFK